MSLPSEDQVLDVIAIGILIIMMCVFIVGVYEVGVYLGQYLPNYLP